MTSVKRHKQDSLQAKAIRVLKVVHYIKCSNFPDILQTDCSIIPSLQVPTCHAYL